MSNGNLDDDLKRALNRLFDENDVDIKIKTLVLYRPVFHEPPFEHIEVIKDAKRVMDCNVVHLVLNMDHYGRNCECELVYKNINGQFQNVSCQLMYCDIFPGEQERLTDIQEKIAEAFKVIGILIFAQIGKLAEEE